MIPLRENKTIWNPCPSQAAPAERSWRGVLRGHVPSKSLSADSETPRAHASGHTEKVGEKSDSFSRAERTRPLRPVSRLRLYDFENVPAERFQRDALYSKNTAIPRQFAQNSAGFTCWILRKILSNKLDNAPKLWYNNPAQMMVQEPAGSQNWKRTSSG